MCYAGGVSPTVGWMRGAGLLLVSVSLIFTALLGADALRARKSEVTVEGLRLHGEPAGGLGAEGLRLRIDALGKRILDEKIALRGAALIKVVTRRQLGLRIDADALVAAALAVGHHEPNPRATVAAYLHAASDRWRARRGRIDLQPELVVDRAAARESLMDLKEDIDRAAVDAHFDLDHHRVEPERAGTLLKVYDALVAVQYLAAAGLDGPRTLALGTSSVPARVSARGLSNIDISTVIGSWETHYSSVGPDTDRTYNLKVGADHLNGHILLPGAQFSFNETVGDRTEREGYRVAPVISGGELVDGLAGGMCQIASTLHAAAFFGGLEIVSSTPHSRPSAYISMGLDSTVVYPTTDLKLKNTYDFPVVMHYTVNQGSVKVELLGKARPNRVIFEREIRAENGFGTESRRDPLAPEGQRLLLQEGYPGYSLVRRRYVFAESALPKVGAKETVEQALARLGAAAPKPVSKKDWALRYPSTARIVAIGSGAKTLKKKDPPPAHRIPPLRPEERGVFRITK